MIVRLGIVLFVARDSLGFVCANLTVVHQVKGSIIHVFLYFWLLNLLCYHGI